MEFATGNSTDYVGNQPVSAGAVPPGRGAKRSLSQEVQLGRLFARIARRHKDRVLLYVQGTAFTYGEVYHLAEQIKDRLRADRAFRVGARVILALENSLEYVAGLYGVLMADATAIPMNPRMEFDRMHRLLDMTEPAYVIALASDPATAFTEHLLDHTESHLGTVQHAMIARRKYHSTTRLRPDQSDASDKVERPAMIVCTSGSTSTPKGVMLSHRNLVYNALAIRRCLRIRRGDCGQTSLPLHYAFGNSILQSHVLAGSSLHLAANSTCFISQSVAGRELPVTTVYGVPDQIRFLWNHGGLGTQYPQLRQVAVAGGALTPHEALAISRQIAPARLVLMYGQTEATARLSYLPADQLEQLPNSIGRGIPGTELQVVDRGGQPVAAGEIGELRARGPGVMLGYWRDLAASQQVLRDGWLYTGDLATVDEQGWFYLHGRQSQWVKVAGHRIHPREVEEFLTQRFPRTRFVVVPYEDPHGNTRLAAFVQEDSRSRMNEQVIMAECRSGLPSHKVPSYIEFLSQFPQTNAGKVALDALARHATTRARSMNPSLHGRR